MAGPVQSYPKAHYNQFVKNARKLGYKPWHYNGRFFFSGPCATVTQDELHNFIAKVGVPCKWDNYAFDYVVYPAG